ncbi:MAG TPA: alcohol dehydrogenase catalytic domain-containing protein [Spirochaetota bacterium]|nr:alcohol dehydrogenase catalytic domain-containing protein [Spirochaetota bacterium]
MSRAIGLLTTIVVNNPIAGVSVNKKYGNGKIKLTRYTDVAEPELPNSKWLKVQNIACGLCGSDIHFMYMELDPKTFPAAIPGISRKYLGHELVGEVTELGKDVRNLKTGDRVCLRIDWPSCYQMELDPMCPQCKKGEYMLCQNLGMKDLPLVDTGGGFSPYMVMHRTQSFKVPTALSNDEAVLIEPLACAVHGVRKQSPEKGDRVLVIGCGTIGLLTIAAARAMQKDIEIIALARYPFQAEMARKMGADNVISGRGNTYEEIAGITGAKYFEGYFGNRILLGGFDIIYDSVGNDRSINDALRWTRSNGAVVILGINFKPGKIDYTPIWNQELRVTGINCHAMEGKKTSFDIAAEILAKKSVPFSSLVTHRFPMNNYRDAIKTFFSKGKEGAIKIVLEHEH